MGRSTGLLPSLFINFVPRKEVSVVVLLCAFKIKEGVNFKKQKNCAVESVGYRICTDVLSPLPDFPWGRGATFVDRLVNLFTRVNDDLIYSVDKAPFCT